MRVLLALWLCVGTLLHVVVEQAAILGHASHHLNDTHGTTARVPLAYAPHDDTLCCYHTPQHQHHDSGAPHAHLTDALAGASQRNLPFVHAAALPLRAIEPLPNAAPIFTVASVSLPSEPPASHNAALRAPPIA